MTSLLDQPHPGPPPVDNLITPHTVTQRESVTQCISAGFLVFVPLAFVGYAVSRFWNRGISWFDLGLAISLYFITGHALSAGFHRLFTHRSYLPKRWLKILIAVVATMAVEGSLITWVAQHRRHHAAADRVGDPHSPLKYGRGLWPLTKGLVFAHIGWFFVPNPSHPERWCPDILADPDLVRVSKLSPWITATSFVFPFMLGWVVTGSIAGAFSAAIWAGAVRVFLLHHVTWSVNSIAHMWGRTPYRTKDNSRNVPLLAILSFGDSWHNAHHAFPTLARHGVDRYQIDSTAGLLKIWERFGWVTGVRWPIEARLEVRRESALADAE